MAETPLASALLIGLFVGLASGTIGSFIILRRMALVGDALSHVALPGIALALAAGIDPFYGVVAPLLFAAVLVWWLENHSKLPTDALVGLLFTASLAIGILTIPNTEILESLFGAFPVVSTSFLVIILAAAAGSTVLTLMFARRFLFLIVSSELAQTSRVPKIYDLVLYALFGFVVALGIKLVGTLLMGALTIIPASIAKNLSRSMSRYIVVSGVLGGLISVAGVLVANTLHVLPGPAIILLGVGLFLLSLFWGRRPTGR